MRDLRLGDIMLKQGFWGDLATAGIGAGQVTLNRSGHRYLGAGLLGHAAVYVGDGKIMESGKGGVVRSRLDGHNPKVEADYREYNWYVIRCNDAPFARRVAELASSLENRINYNGWGLVPATVIGNAGYISKFNKVREDPTKSDRRKLDTNEKPEMFCSEFVVFCLNDVADRITAKRFIDIDQDRISPEELYVKLRDHSDFSYVGELHKHVR